MKARKFFKGMFLSLMLILSTNVSAEKFVVDGICYEYESASSTTVKVTSRGGIKYTGDIIIPSSVRNDLKVYCVTEIGASAFSNCPDLTSVEIPNTVTTIGMYAFSYCYGLTSIKLPNSVANIEGRAFHECTALRSVNIPVGVTTIGYGTFYGCFSLTSIEIPSNVTIINPYAFSGCSRLSAIEIPSSVTEIGEKAFEDCAALTSIEIPNSVKTMGNCVFAGCYGLKSIIVKGGNTAYDSRGDCNAIIETSTNALVTGCISTRIPNTVSIIKEYAFYNCYDLTSIEIPSSITTIERYAFEGCSGLMDVYCKNPVPCSSTVYAFYNARYEDAKLYVPVGALAAYQVAAGWKCFNNIVEYQLPEAGKYYRIKSYRSQDAKSCLSMVNAYAPVDGIPVMKNEDDNYRMLVRVSAEDAAKDLSSLWTPVAADGGVGTALKNANMSCYLGKDQYCSSNQTGAGYCYFGVGSISGTVTIQNFQDGSGYLQDDGDNSIVRTDAPDAEGKLWYFEEVASVPVEIGAAGWASLVLPYAVTLPDGVDAYYAENGIAGDVLTLKKWQELDLPAYMPVFLMGTAGEYALTITTTDVEKPENALKGHTMKRMHFSDGEPNPSVTFENIYALRKNEAALGLVTGINAFPANRAYVEAPVNAVKVVRFGFGDATGMVDAAIQQWSAKDEIYYDMNGRRVWNPKRGIYVTASGKTVFINK